MADKKNATPETDGTEKKSRPRRTTEQRIKDLEAKLAEKQAAFDKQKKKIEDEIAELKKPKLTEKQKKDMLLKAAMDAAGGSIEEMVKKLGIDVNSVLGTSEGETKSE